MTDMYVRQNEEIAYRIVDSEAIVLTPDDGMLHTLNAVGTRILELADGKRKVSDIARYICEEFQIDQEACLADTKHFIDDLVHKKMLLVSVRPLGTSLR